MSLSLLFLPLKLTESHAQAKQHVIRSPRRTLGANSVEKVLNELANLTLVDRSPFADRQNVENAVRHTKEDTKKLRDDKPPDVVIDLTASSADSASHTAAPPKTIPKAAQLRNLTLAVPGAPNNHSLAKIVSEFVSVLIQANRSRMLTKDGFAFLDVLQKQLAGPDALVLPLRMSRTRASSDKEKSQGQELKCAKLGHIARLRRDVREAKSSRQLAKMVSDFCAVTNVSGGRTITKDGFAFLEGLA